MSNVTLREGPSAPAGPLPSEPSRRQLLIDGGCVVAAVGLASACGGDPLTSSAACLATPSGMTIPGAETLAVNAVQAVTIAGRPFFVARDGGGFMAMSGACTHAGCTVGFTTAGATFDCPCHLSQFAIDGSVKSGPAPTPLPHVLLCRNSSGQLVIDTTMAVATSDRLK